MVACLTEIGKYLGFVLESSEGGGMNYPVAVALIFGSIVISWYGILPATAVF
jgi:hypothetical protein